MSHQRSHASFLQPSILTRITVLRLGSMVIGFGAWLYGEFSHSDTLVQGIAVWAPIGFGIALVVISRYAIHIHSLVDIRSRNHAKR